MANIHDFEPLFGEWKIEEKLGAGSYGSVYSAVRTEFGREYRSAIKHISIPIGRDELNSIYEEGYAYDENSARRYYQQVLVGLIEEIELMDRLKGNTNIVAYEDHKIIEKKDMPGYDVFIRMELLKNLHRALGSGPITPAEVCRLGIDICTALEVLGKEHIVHRDIKPANILVNNLGDYKLADFGVARKMERTTTVMSVKGTYTYMAPEVFKGEAAGPGADIYSLGIVLYRLLNNNRAPFVSVNAAEVTPTDNETALGRRMRGEPLPMPAHADSWLGSIILTACAFRKEDRFLSPTAFKRALQEYLANGTAGNASAAAAPTETPYDKTTKLDPTVYGQWSAAEEAVRRKTEAETKRKAEAEEAARRAKQAEAKRKAEEEKAAKKKAAAARAQKEEVEKARRYAAAADAAKLNRPSKEPLRRPQTPEDAAVSAKIEETRKRKAKRAVLWAMLPCALFVALILLGRLLAQHFSDNMKTETTAGAAVSTTPPSQAVEAPAVTPEQQGLMRGIDENSIVLARGQEHAVGLRADGTVVAVGGSHGQDEVDTWQNVVSVAAGTFHTVGLRGDGTVVAVGSEWACKNVADWENVTAIAAGGDYTVGLKKDGTVLATDMGGGACDVADWRDIVDIAAGYCHTVGLRADGTVAAVSNIDNEACDVASWRDIVDVAAGEFSTFGLRADGTVVMAGNATEMTKEQIAALHYVTAIHADDEHIFARLQDGTSVIISDNEEIQPLSGRQDVAFVAGKYDISLLLKTDGTVELLCSQYVTEEEKAYFAEVLNWQLAVPKKTVQTSVPVLSDPTEVQGLALSIDENSTVLAAGKHHTVGLRADGTVVATGRNSDGQCDVSDWKNVVSLAAGSNHTVGLCADGTVLAAGYYGDGNPLSQCNVENWKNVIAVAAGGEHTVGLKSDGTVVAIGMNGYSQCDVSQWRDIISIAAGTYHTVGLKADGTVVAVGNDITGQCKVTDWKDVVAVSAGLNHTVGLKSDGTVVAAGWNQYNACDVEKWEDIIGIIAGEDHTVGLKADGTVMACGRNKMGQCDVNDWKNIVAVAAGYQHTVGLKKDGTVVAVGSNNNDRSDVSSWQLAVPGNN